MPRRTHGAKSVLLTAAALAGGILLGGCTFQGVYNQGVRFCNDSPDPVVVGMVDGNNPRPGETIRAGECATVGALLGRGSSGAIRVVRAGGRPRLIAVHATDPMTEETTVRYAGDPRR